MIPYAAHGRPAGWRATVGTISLNRGRAAAEHRGSRRAVATILERVSSHGGSIHNSQLGHPAWTASDVTRHVRVQAKLAVGISTATHRRLLYGCRAHVTVGMRRERTGQYSTALSESPAPPLGSSSGRTLPRATRPVSVEDLAKADCGLQLRMFDVLRSRVLHRPDAVRGATRERPHL